MSDPRLPDLALILRGVSKVYRLYQKPVYRVLDVLGLCPSGSRFYHEHPALSGINLEVPRGQKLAIIGRNGAGKSTLLKIITQTIRPTDGSIDVRGKVSALLQIGTGFHPDFTGRQNVYAGFAHMGISGKRADELFEEVVDFAELEEYIDQPMKTYSTGMAARLMFSAATVLVPDILVIDEMLGVGDAYFAHKSFERMRQMCTQHSTTLLLVTHDIYSALNLCDRFIWIDRGRIKMEGDGKATIKAYENSIKEQEEERLRRRNEAALTKQKQGFTGLRVRVSSRSGFALPSPLSLERLEIRYNDGTALTLAVAKGAPAWNLLPEGNLGPPATVAGQRCRSLYVYGSIFHKAEWLVTIPSDEDLREFEAHWHYEGDESVDLSVLTDDNRALLRHSLVGAKGWQRTVLPLSVPKSDDVARPLQGHYGTGMMRIRSLDFQDSSGSSVVRAPHGEPLFIRVEFVVSSLLESREPTFVVGFHKAGVSTGAYVHTDRLVLPHGKEFELRVEMNPLLLGSGDWLVTVGFAEADFYKRDFNPYFSVNDRWHHLITRGYDLHVDSSTSIDGSSFFVHPSAIEVRAVESAPAPSVESSVAE